MNACVWISTAPGHASNQRPLRHSFSEGPQLQWAIASKQRNMSGEPLGRDHFPEEIYGAPNARESSFKLPDIFHAGSYWVVSGAAADILRRFDLGGGALYPVRVLKSDRQTPVDGDWQCVNFGNRKDAFLPDQSCSFNFDSIRQGEKGWFARAAMKDDDFALSQAALQGSDIWIDYRVGDAFFISDRLRRGLKQAKADKGFFLNRCRVIAA